MNILILGGGVFLGTATLDAALARGHAVTVFNRGRSRSTWPSGAEVLTGDRGTDLGVFAGRRWDAVIDTCGYTPTEVAESAEALRDSGCYLFVSSISAYAAMHETPVREDAPLLSAAGIARDDRDRRHYGAQKAAAEAEVERVFGRRALIVRPGLVVGPGDPTGRFSHWPWRSAEGGAMLVPDMADDSPLQFIDVRDLGAWMVDLVERGARGRFTANGPTHGDPLGWAALLHACRDAALVRGFVPASPVRVSEAFLLAQGVSPWSELPLWLPSSDRGVSGYTRTDLSRARAAGLRTRPIAETVAAVMDAPTPPRDHPSRVNPLTLAREAELLAAWAARLTENR